MTGTRADRRGTIQSRAAALAGAQSHDGVRTARAAVEDDQQGGTTTTRGELWLFGVVGAYWWGFSSDSVADALAQLGDVDEIVVRLDSPGGAATQGLSIANLLANHGARVTVVVDGLAASAASQIALAGDEVVMSPGAQFMLHDAWMLTVGNAAELRSDGDWLDKQSQNYAETYAHRAGGTAEHWREVMLADNGRGTWFTAQEAVTAGLADRVGNIASTGTPPPEPDLDGEDSEGAEARAAFDLDVLVAPSVRSAWTQQHPPSRRAADAPKPPSAAAVGSTHPKERSSDVAFTTEQLTTMRQELGVAEDADEATIVAALSESLSERAETPTVTTTVPAGMTLVETDVLTELRTGAQAGRDAREQQQAETRDRAVQSAVEAGKITPARREHWTKSWDADPDGTKALLDSLEAGLVVPTSEAGHAGSELTDDALAVDDDALAAFAAGLGLTKEALRG